MTSDQPPPSVEKSANDSTTPKTVGEQGDSIETVIALVHKAIETGVKFSLDKKKFDEKDDFTVYLPDAAQIKDEDVRKLVVQLVAFAQLNESGSPSAGMFMANVIEALDIKELQPLEKKYLLQSALRDVKKAQMSFGQKLSLASEGTRSFDAEALGWFLAATRDCAQTEISTQIYATASLAGLAAVSPVVPSNDLFQVGQLLGFITRQLTVSPDTTNLPRFPLASKYTAMTWEKYALEGSPDAMFNLGVIYLDGDGVPVDTAAALYWLLKGSRLNHKMCLKALSSPRYSEYLYKEPISYPVELKAKIDQIFGWIRDEDKAPGVDFEVPSLPDIQEPTRLGPLPEFEGDQDLIEYLTICKVMSGKSAIVYGKACGDKEREDAAREGLLQAVKWRKMFEAKFKAGKGDADAKVDYVLLRKDVVETNDEEESKKLIAEAAAEGNAKALYHHADNQSGFDATFTVLKQSAEKGYGPACYKVGQIYESGVQSDGKILVARDCVKALEAYAKAENDADCIYRRSIILKNGKGVDPDPETALTLCKQAVAMGHIEASFSLGMRLSSSASKQHLQTLENDETEIASKERKQASMEAFKYLRYVERLHDREPSQTTLDVLDKMPKLFSRVWLMEEGVDMHKKAVAGDMTALLNLFTAFKFARFDDMSKNIFKTTGLYLETLENCKNPETQTEIAILSLLALADIFENGENSFTTANSIIAPVDLPLSKSYRELATELLLEKTQLPLTNIPKSDNEYFNAVVSSKVEEISRMSEMFKETVKNDMGKTVKQLALKDQKSAAPKPAAKSKSSSVLELISTTTTDHDLANGDESSPKTIGNQNDSIETVISVVRNTIDSGVALAKGLKCGGGQQHTSNHIADSFRIKDVELRNNVMKLFSLATAAEMGTSADAGFTLAMEGALKCNDAEALGCGLLMAATRFSYNDTSTGMHSIAFMAALGSVSYAFQTHIEFPLFPLDGEYAAMTWQKYALEGNPDAMCELAFIYTEGEGIPMDKTAALYWFLQPVRLNHKVAIKSFCKSEDLFGEYPIELRPVLANICDMVSKQGKRPGIDFEVPMLPDIPVPTRLGTLPECENDDPGLNDILMTSKRLAIDRAFDFVKVLGNKDEEDKCRDVLLSTIKWNQMLICEHKAKGGDVHAKVEYVLLHKELHADKEDKEIYTHMCKPMIAEAAAEGHPEALYHHSHYQSNIIEKMDYLRHASDKGYGPACFALGQIYENGVKNADWNSVVDPNCVKALEVYAKAEGGVDPDPETGLVLCKQAVCMGHLEASYSLGLRLSAAAALVLGALTKPTMIIFPRYAEIVWEDLVKEGVELYDRTVAGDKEALWDLFLLSNLGEFIKTWYVIKCLIGLLVDAEMPEGLYELATTCHIAKHEARKNVWTAIGIYYDALEHCTNAESHTDIAILSLIALADIFESGESSLETGHRFIAPKNSSLAKSHRALTNDLLLIKRNFRWRSFRNAIGVRIDLVKKELERQKENTLNELGKIVKELAKNDDHGVKSQ
ncbi:hypothetical protein HDU76_003941, partial [Blyttiomyces sp. JEL0837]